MTVETLLQWLICLFCYTFFLVSVSELTLSYSQAVSPSLQIGTQLHHYLLAGTLFNFAARYTDGQGHIWNAHFKDGQAALR